MRFLGREPEFTDIVPRKRESVASPVRCLRDEEQEPVPMRKARHSFNESGGLYLEGQCTTAVASGVGHIDVVRPLVLDLHRTDILPGARYVLVGTKCNNE